MNTKISGEFSFFSVAALLIAIFGVPVCVALIGAPVYTAALTTAIVCSCILIILVAVNAVMFFKIYRKRYDLKQMRERLLTQKDLLLQNYGKHYRKVKIMVFLANCYIFFFYVCTAAINSVLLSNAPNTPELWIITVILVIAQLVFLGKLSMSPEEPGIGLSMVIKEQRFLIDLAHAAMASARISLPFLLIACPGCNASVVKRRKNLHFVFVGLDLLSLLSAEELTAVFKHEFAHMKNKDTKLSFYLERKKNKWEYLSQQSLFFPSFMFYPLGTKLSYLLDEFIFLSSYRVETRADASFVQPNERQHAANSFAKLDLYNINAAFVPPSASIYKPETPPEDVIAFHLNAFKENYSANKEDWEELALSQLPARLDSHPNLPERMKNLDINSFTVDFNQNNELLERDAAALRKSFHEFFMKDIDWEAEKTFNYTERLKLANEYESAPEAFEEKLDDVAFNYIELGDYKKAKPVYAKLLAASPDNPNYLYRYALILSYERDNLCMDYFIKCMDSILYVTPAMTRMAVYLQYCGKQELREAYHDKVMEKAAPLFEFSTSRRISKQRAFLSEEDRKKICSYLKHDDFKAAVIFGMQSNDHKGNFLLVLPSPALSPSQTNIAMEKLAWFVAENFPNVLFSAAYADSAFFKLVKNPKFCLKGSVVTSF